MTKTNILKKIAESDSDYKFGVVYFNTTDTRVVVPKKHGGGWTFNLGHPVGQLATVATVALIVVPMVRKRQRQKGQKCCKR